MSRLSSFINVPKMLISLLSPMMKQNEYERLFFRMQRASNPHTFEAVQLFHLLELMVVLRDSYTSLYADYLNPDVDRIFSDTIDSCMHTIAKYSEQIRQEAEAHSGAGTL